MYCYVAATGQWKTAKWLIDSDVGGKLVTSKDNNGDTPAHDAADNGSVHQLCVYYVNSLACVLVYT